MKSLRIGVIALVSVLMASGPVWGTNPFDFLRDKRRPNPVEEEQPNENGTKPTTDPKVLEAIKRCKEGDVRSCVDPFHCIIYGKGLWEGEWNASSPLESEGRCVPRLTKCLDLGEGAKDAVIKRGEWMQVKLVRDFARYCRDATYHAQVPGYDTLELGEDVPAFPPHQALSGSEGIWSFEIRLEGEPPQFTSVRVDP
jgi:hypothetical protein